MRRGRRLPGSMRAGAWAITRLLAIAVIGASFAGTATASQFRWLRWTPPHATVDTNLTEKIIAPADHQAWTGSYGWESHYRIVVTAEAITAVISLYSPQPAAVRAIWAAAACQKWDGQLRLATTGGSLPFVLRIRWIADETRADYTITTDAAGATNGGYGTTSLTNWGIGDTTDVGHEVGHMLGARDAYFQVNDVQFPLPNSPNSGIMNNPVGPPHPRDIALVARAVSRLMGSTWTPTRN